MFHGILATVAAMLAVGAAVPHLMGRAIPRPGKTPADAVFVLTGGDTRIEEGYKAWREGKGKDLYIIGAGGDARLKHILPGRIAPSDAVPERIHIEGWSENTLENAFSVNSTVRSRGLRSLILVTSDYHMPRAYFAVRKVVSPGVSIAVLPIRSEGGGIKGFFRSMRRHFLEGWKYWGYRLLLVSE